MHSKLFSTLLAQSIVAVLIALAVSGRPSFGAAPSWPQFRGPGGLAVADSDANPPVHFSLATNVMWKTALPSGHSSPCIWGEKIFLTGVDQGKLETLCLDRRNGRILWRQPAPAERIDATHRIGSP